MDHFPNLPRDPAPPAPVKAAVAAAGAAKKTFNLMYVWVGLAAVSFAALGYWGFLRPAPTDADATNTAYIPEVKSAAERAKEDALTDMIKRLKEQEANRVIVLEGSRNAEEIDQKATGKPPKEMVIKFTPSTQPSTRPAGGRRTKPLLAPDIAEDGSFYGQIDKPTGRPKTVYSSTMRKYIVDSGIDHAERDAEGNIIEKYYPPASAGGAALYEAEGNPKAVDYSKSSSSSSGTRGSYVKNPTPEYKHGQTKRVESIGQ